MTEVLTNPHLADVISENGLVLCASDLPLEPGLRLAVVGNLQRRCTVADLGQIGHGVSDGDGSVNSTVSSVDRQTIVCMSHVRFPTTSLESFHYRVTLLTNFLSSTTTFREQALGANTCKGSG